MKRMRRAAMPTTILTILLALMIMLTAAGCSTANVMSQGGSAEELFGAMEDDLFGAGEQVYYTLSVSLPRHAGYAMIEDKVAYATLDTEAQRTAYATIEERVFQVTNEAGGSNGRYALRRMELPDLTSGEILKVKEAVLADHPEVFWVLNNYSLGYNLHDGHYMVMYTNYSHTELEERIDALEAGVAQALREIPSGLNEYDRELLIHDILVRDVTYDVEAVEAEIVFSDASTSYGALVDRKAVCSGYSHAAKILLNRVGMSCTMVKGISNDEAHMWNLVKVDGKWYHLDITWNDPVSYTASGSRIYDYFNLSDAYIAYDHSIADNYDMLTDEFIASQEQPEDGYFFNFDLPECNSTDANYYERNAVPVNTLSDDSVKLIGNLMTTMSKTQEETVYLQFPLSMDREVIEVWLDAALVEAMRISNRSGSGTRIESCSRTTKSTGGQSWNNVYTVTLFYKQ